MRELVRLDLFLKLQARRLCEQISHYQLREQEHAYESVLAMLVVKFRRCSVPSALIQVESII